MFEKFSQLFPNVFKNMRIDEKVDEEALADFIKNHYDVLKEEEERYNLCDSCTPEQMKDCIGLLLQLVIWGSAINLSYFKCEKKAKALSSSKLALVDVFHEYECFSLDNFKFSFSNRELKTILATFENSQIGFFLIQGPVGSGKTHFSVGLAKKLLSEFKTVIYIPLFDLKSKIDFDDIEDVFNRMKLVDYLFLDDLGAEKISDFLNEKLLQIIDYRMRTQKSTLVISNLSLQQLGEIYGPRIVSRLKSFKLIEIESRDFRKEA